MGGMAGRVRAPEIPRDRNDVALKVGGHTVQLTNLHKVFWPGIKVTKGDLLRYYAAIAPVLLPHLKDRAMTMKRYPNGVKGEFFFMKNAADRPSWVKGCDIPHNHGRIVDFAMVQDVGSLLWMVNLGCIDLNPWYSRCDDTNRPDYLHFDLDPGPGVPFGRVLEVALVVREALTALGMPSYPKTTGASGVHVYVPIVRGPTQKEVWTFAKALAQTLGAKHPKIITTEFRIAKRAKGRVLVDYNQNVWGKTLASVYSVRPQAKPTVSAPVTWEEIEDGVKVSDFHMGNMIDRVADVGDLWKPVDAKTGRFRLEKLL